jgi:hypothetical protein
VVEHLVKTQTTSDNVDSSSIVVTVSQGKHFLFDPVSVAHRKYREIIHAADFLIIPAGQHTQIIMMISAIMKYSKTHQLSA